MQRGGREELFEFNDGTRWRYGGVAERPRRCPSRIPCSAAMDTVRCSRWVVGKLLKLCLETFAASCFLPLHVNMAAKTLERTDAGPRYASEAADP